jgi:hypothetical protein
MSLPTVDHGTFVFAFPVLDDQQTVADLTPEARDRYFEEARSAGVLIDGDLSIDTVEGVTAEHAGIFLRVSAPAHRAPGLHLAPVLTDPPVDGASAHCASASSSSRSPQPTSAASTPPLKES